MPSVTYIEFNGTAFWDTLGWAQNHSPKLLIGTSILPAIAAAAMAIEVVSAPSRSATKLRVR